MALTDLPFDKGKRICKVFESIGFELKGRSEKNHFILQRPNDPHLFISIPDHPKVDRQTLKAEIRKAGLTDAQFRVHYDAMYAKPKGAPLQLVQVEVICPLCREVIEPGRETVQQQSGLDAHRECHEKQFGPAGTNA
jgi:HicA-like toxin of HicAB toxin-antitoxin system